MLLQVSNLSGGYGEKMVCHNLSFHLNAGEILSVLGPNGSGKTTMFRLLLGFMPSKEGDILIQGRPAASYSEKEIARKIAYIPQAHNAVFPYTVLEVVLMGRAGYISPLSRPKGEDRKKAFEALEKLRIDYLANQIYTDLSGGQQQLVLIARALCQEPELLIMDEPGSSLDYANQQLLMDIISDLATQGYGIVLSTHSPEHPFSIAQKVLIIKEGRRVSFGAPGVAITPEILLETYGIEMDVVSVQDRYDKTRTLCLPLLSRAL